MAKKITQQTTTQTRSSKQKVTQQSAPLATASSPLEKSKKPKAAEVASTLPSIPPVSTPENVKQAKAKPAESTSAVVHSSPPPTEVAKVTSPAPMFGSVFG
jgi:hypothetical protein